MGKPLRILMIEDSPDDAELLLRELRIGGYDPIYKRVETDIDMKEALEQQEWDIVLSDHSMPRFSALGALMQLQLSGRDLPFIIVSGIIGEEIAVTAMRAGAHDYVMKNNIGRLIPAIERELKEAEERRKHRQAEVTLCEREEQLRILSYAVEQSPNIIVITDPYGAIEYVNPKFTGITGYTPKEVIGKNPHILKSNKTSREEHERLWKAVITTGEWRGQLVNKKKNGELYWENIHISPIRDSKGNVTHFLKVAEDITQIKHAEEEKEKLRAQLYHAQRLESIGKLSGAIAHDFNSILSAIIGYGEILQKEIKRIPILAEYSLMDIAQRILSSAEKGIDLTKGLLTFSRKQIINLKPVNLNELIKQSSSILLSLIRKGIAFKNILTDKDCTIMADRNQIEQALINLAMNARDAMPNGGRDNNTHRDCRA